MRSRGTRSSVLWKLCIKWSKGHFDRLLKNTFHQQGQSIHQYNNLYDEFLSKSTHDSSPTFDPSLAFNSPHNNLSPCKKAAEHIKNAQWCIVVARNVRYNHYLLGFNDSCHNKALIDSIGNILCTAKYSFTNTHLVLDVIGNV